MTIEDDNPNPQVRHRCSRGKGEREEKGIVQRRLWEGGGRGVRVYLWRLGRYNNYQLSIAAVSFGVYVGAIAWIVLIFTASSHPSPLPPVDPHPASPPRPSPPTHTTATHSLTPPSHTSSLAPISLTPRPPSCCRRRSSSRRSRRFTSRCMTWTRATQPRTPRISTPRSRYTLCEA